MKKSELKRHIIEALTPQEADKVDSKYKEIYGGMLKGNKKKLMKYIDPESGRPNPDKVAYGRAIKLIQKESANLKEKELTAAEKRKKEDIIMSLKKQKGGKDKLEPSDYAIATSRAKKLAEITGNTRKMEDLLSKILRAINNVDKSQDDTEDDVEELDKSIDYLSAALTDKDPLDIAIDQSTFGRLAKPANEEKTLEEIDAIMEESAYDKGRLEKKVKSILKKEGGAVGLKPLVDAAKELGATKKDLMGILKKMKDVKTHKDGDIIDTGGLNETGQAKAKKNMDMYKDKNRLQELIKSALMGPINENRYDINDPNSPLGKLNDEYESSGLKSIVDKYGLDVVLMMLSSGEYGDRLNETSTDKYDDNPALKGKQSELPDGLQKAIIKKSGGKVDEAELPGGVLTKLNQEVKDIPTMAKAMLNLYNQIKDKEKISFDSNASMKIVLAKLQDLASKAKGKVDENIYNAMSGTYVDPSNDYKEYKAKELKLDKTTEGIRGVIAQMSDAYMALGKELQGTTNPKVGRYMNAMAKEIKRLKRMLKGMTNESFDSLVKKVDKEKGYTKKEAEKVAGAIAAKKMKGAGKGPTAKQKKRMAETILKSLREENQKLTPQEQDIFDDITSSLNEGMFDNVLEKVKKYARKGLMTVALLAALTAPNLGFSQVQQQQLKDVAQTEMSTTEVSRMKKIGIVTTALNNYKRGKNLDKLDDNLKQDLDGVKDGIKNADQLVNIFDFNTDALQVYVPLAF